MNVEELKQKALAATPGPWYDRCGVLRGTGGEVKPIATIYNGLNSPYIAAANPAAILALIAERDELLAALDAIVALPSHPMRKKSVEIAIAAKAKVEG